MILTGSNQVFGRAVFLLEALRVSLFPALSILEVCSLALGPSSIFTACHVASLPPSGVTAPSDSPVSLAPVHGVHQVIQDNLPILMSANQQSPATSTALCSDRSHVRTSQDSCARTRVVPSLSPAHPSLNELVFPGSVICTKSPWALRGGPELVFATHTFLLSDQRECFMKTRPLCESLVWHLHGAPSAPWWEGRGFCHWLYSDPSQERSFLSLSDTRCPCALVLCPLLACGSD